ncbi:MAG: class I SAM-dependent methyltransferase [Thermoanaerobaculia bacterium]|nr:class I SAM-dependent methyltransferase [Thermoanaerobaculia bacterium]
MTRVNGHEVPAPEKALVQRLEFLDGICRGRSVLHFGCTNWPYTQTMLGAGGLLHLRLAKTARELWGLDSDPEGLRVLGGHGVPNLVRGDAEALDSCPLDRNFEVVLAGEILEHLSNPGLFLRGVRRFLAPEGRLVLTTVNAYCGFRFAQYFFRGRGGAVEPVHPDHVAYYSYRTLTHLLARAGYAVESFRFYDLGDEHVPFVPRRIRVANRFFSRLAPWTADGVIAVCRAGEGA